MNKHNKGQSLAQLGILFGNILCALRKGKDHGKDSANLDQFHSLVSVSLPEYIQEVLFVERGRTTWGSHPVRRGKSEGQTA
jgi:hypothetical protein